jgi:hypothetical protein
VDEDYDVELGTAAQILHRDGATQAASLLLEAQLLDYTLLDIAFNMRHMDEPNAYMVAAVLEVPAALADRFTPEITDQIRGALAEVAFRERRLVEEVRIVPALAEANWRERMEAALGLSPTNQAALGPPVPDRFPKVDRMRFRDAAEVRLYEGLKRSQEAADPQFTIVPNAAVRVPGRTWEVDFLILLGGRAGVIEVDGATHSRKWSSDRSRDRVLEDAGVAYIDRIDAEDTKDPLLVDQFIQRFLRKLHA